MMNPRDKMASRKQQGAETTADTVSLYMQDVEQRDRLTREEETALVREMIRRREEIADLLRAVLLKACDKLGIDAPARRAERRASRKARTDGPSEPPIEAYVAELPKLRARNEGSRCGKLRAAIASLADKARLRNLEAKILSTAEFARRELRALQQGVTANGAPAEARRIVTEIAASFGVTAADIERVATAIAENRRAIEQTKRRLVESNLRLVVFFARRAKWRGAEMADLIQEGNIALMNAVDSFDPDYGLPFGTFATIGVRRAIHRFGASAGELVHIPEEVRWRRRRVYGAAQYLAERRGAAPSWDEIASYLDMPRSEVAEAFEAYDDTVSLDAEDSDTAPLSNVIADAKAVDAEGALSAFEEERHVRHEIGRLDDRSRELIQSRYDVRDRGATLAEIGREFGVTRERARQIESAALRTLRTRGGTSGRTPARRPRRRSVSAF